MGPSGAPGSQNQGSPTSRPSSSPVRWPCPWCLRWRPTLQRSNEGHEPRGNQDYLHLEREMYHWGWSRLAAPMVAMRRA